MMDEDEANNQPIPPEGAQPVAPGAGQSRQASPEEEKMFTTMVKQALSALTSPEAGEMLLAAAQSKSPEQAIAQAVSEVLSGVMQAAKGAGVNLPPEVSGAAAQPIVQVLVKVFVEAGVAQDPQALYAAVMQLIQGGASDGPAV